MLELTDVYGKFCLIGFMANTEDNWVLGDIFFRNYYSIWDDSNNQLTFAPKKDGAVTLIPTTDSLVPIAQVESGARNITT